MRGQICSMAVRGFSRTRSPDAVRRAADFVEAAWRHAGRPADHGEEHDRLMAAVSHLPQVTATLLMAVAARRSARKPSVGRQWPAGHDSPGVEPRRHVGRACCRSNSQRAQAADAVHGV